MQRAGQPTSRGWLCSNDNTQCGPKVLELIFLEIEDTCLFFFLIQNELHWHIYRLLRGRTVSEKLPKIPLFGPSTLLFSNVSKRTVGPTQPLLQSASGALYLDVKKTEREVDHALSLTTKGKNEWVVQLHCPHAFMACTKTTFYPDSATIGYSVFCHLQPILFTTPLSVSVPQSHYNARATLG